MSKGNVKLQSQEFERCTCCGEVGHNSRQCRAPGMKQPIGVVVAVAPVTDRWWQAVDAWVWLDLKTELGKIC